jgi:uncharacterized protein YllA (UPF0747 family)
MRDGISILKNRAVAWVLTGLVVILSAGYGVSKTMAALRAEAETFYTGEYSITEDLDRKIAVAHNINTIASKYLETYYTNPLRQSIADLEAADSPLEDYNASLKLDTAAKTLGIEFLASMDPNIKDSDLNYIRQLLTDIDGINDVISRSEYNQKATEYNAELKKMPVALFSGLFMFPALELYSE